MIGAKTHFSIGESILQPEDLVDVAHELGHNKIAVADTGNINAMPILSAEAKKRGMVYIAGGSIQVVDDIRYRKVKGKKTTNPSFYPSLYIRNAQGLRDLMALYSLAADDDHFYESPQIDLDELLRTAASGNVTVTTGSAFSLFAHHDYAQRAERLADAVQASKLVLEVQPVHTPYYDTLNAKTLRWWFDTGREAQLVISRPALHLPDDSHSRVVMDCILNRSKVSEPWRRTPAQDLHPLSTAELSAEVADMLNRLVAQGRLTRQEANTVLVASAANTAAFLDAPMYQWEKMPVSLPNMAADPFKELVDRAMAGWKVRLNQEILGYQPTEEQKQTVYRERLKYELSVLRKMKFESYFLLVSQLTTWCKGQGITVGPGRGSVGGSLVAFLMGITDVDPIRFGLFFERFINPERQDLPDIDLDFMSSRREEVIEYLVNEFGHENVAGISNYAELGPPSALRSVGAVYGLKESDFDCSKLVPKRHGQSVPLEATIDPDPDDKDLAVPELDRFRGQHPEVWSVATRLQNTLRGYARHAAGVIVAGEPVANRAVVENRSGAQVVNWDKRVVEDFGLIKLDILGLSTLDILGHAARYIEERHYGKKIDLYSIRLDDPAVLAAFGKGDTVGVFQFESGGMRRLLKDLAKGGPLRFEDLVAATALFRPGPIESKMMETYVSIRQGALFPQYPHPSMKPALEETLSVIVYQEQVMQVARDLAGFTMAEADGLRKAMGKKDADKMAAMSDKWVEGCVKTSALDRHTAKQLFDQIAAFAGYGFNKSHSVEYTIISFWSMWLKVNYPAEFFAAALTVLGEAKWLGLAMNADEHGLLLMPPDVNVSTNRYEIGFDTLRHKTALYAPLQAVKGLSETGAASILEARKTGKFLNLKDFEARVNRRSVNVRVREVLDKVGAFATIEPGQLHPLDVSRLKDQKQLMPGLIVQSVRADRSMPTKDKFIQTKLVEIVTEISECERCSKRCEPHVKPSIGSKPVIMVVMDSPNHSEEQAGIMGKGKMCDYLKQALSSIELANGKKMGFSNLYLTALVRVRRDAKDKMHSNETILACSPYLDREIELLKPPVIVTLGTSAAHHLLPDVKGNWEALAGQVHYHPKLDASIICGFNPQMIYFHNHRLEVLTEVFKKAAEIAGLMV